MSLSSTMRNKWTWIVGVPVLLVVLVVGGVFVYINFINDPAPRLKLETVPTSKSGTPPTASQPAAVDGAWKVKPGSKVQYRVPEVLFAQSTEAVGSTTAVTGDMTIDGTSVENATFTADLTKVTSDESNRDRQFQGRIMNTAEFPNATFVLTQPIAFGSVPDNGERIQADATGDLTLHGTKRSVTFPVVAQRNGDAIETQGTIPITFADYGIPAPSFGPAEVGDSGELEFLISFTRTT